MKKAIKFSITITAISLMTLFIISLSASTTLQAADTDASSFDLQTIEKTVKNLQTNSTEGYQSHIAKSSSIAESLAMLTGEAVNPLLGVTARSVWVWAKTPEEKRAELAWFYQPKIWSPLLLVMLAMLFNSTIVEAFPPAKVPLNAMGDMINKSGAVVSMPIVLAMFADSMTQPMGESIQTIWSSIDLFPVAHAAETASGAGQELIHMLGYGASIILGAFIYIVVWVAFNTIDVLILICPFPAVDATLKSTRLAIMGALTGITQLSPTIGLILAIPVFLICLLIAGWSQRLSVFGFIYATDILLLRNRWETKVSGKVRAFSNQAITNKLPIRTCGRLTKTESGKLLFSYRPWLIFPRREIELEGITQDYSAGSGILNPYIVKADNNERVYLRLPPRYRTHEEEIKTSLELGGVCDVSILRGFRALWGILKGEDVVTSAKE